MWCLVAQRKSRVHRPAFFAHKIFPRLDSFHIPFPLYGVSGDVNLEAEDTATPFYVCVSSVGRRTFEK